MSNNSTTETPQNFAAYLPGPKRALEVRPAPLPVPTEPGQLVIAVHAIPLMPADYKMQKGLLPIPVPVPVPVPSPAILGMSLAGTVHAAHPSVTRFRPGDRVISCTATILRDGDTRWGGQQRYALTDAAMTSRIPASLPFDAACTAASTLPNILAALCLHLDVERPAGTTRPAGVRTGGGSTILVWGASSGTGSFAVQVASLAGWNVVAVAGKGRMDELKTLGAHTVLDYRTEHVTLVHAVVAAGPYRCVFSAADDAQGQRVFLDALARQGGGRFIATMGLREGVELPKGVTGGSVQFLDRYLEEANREFTEWVFWDWMEKVLDSGVVRTGRYQVLEGGLSVVEEGLRMVEKGEVREGRIVVGPFDG